ncbi:MAG: IclR family transcriptional regulator [Georgenia sp.]
MHESASIAMMDRDRARYIGHVPSTRSMRMFNQVGNEADLHATGVGKAILSTMSDDEVRSVLARTGMHSVTPRTITDISVMVAEMDLVRRRGYALDEEEQELGVSCVAVPVPGPVRLAMSISGPQSR